ncbi:hypothetical protein C8R47DRAFT_1079626 [Mycena vitilis]|nr:hypothetical protein C8R47DRAFT_1079626 [Mycena vitilis]
MSSIAPKLVPTNLSLELLVMDDREGGKDGRYYCLPPFYGTPGVRPKSGGGHAFHLVSQGRRVGIHDEWLQAQNSVTGFPNSAHRGYDSVDECIDAWQGLCVLGIHPHPVDPHFVTTPPPATGAQPAQPSRPVKTQEDGGKEMLTNLKRFASPVRSPTPSPSKRSHGHVNFAIRGDGVVSSSPIRAHERYLEMQRRGEEPDLLVTRNLLHASRFALDDEDEDKADTEAEAGPRERQGLAPVKPGKASWVAGTKLVLFESLRDDYLAAAEIKETGAFYSRVAGIFVGTYGHNMDWHDDLAEGQTVADDVDPDEDVDSLTQAEGERRAMFFKTLRGKIGVWFNSTYGRSVEKKKKNKKVTFRAIFDKPELDPPQPVKTRILHYYSRHFYDQRIKPLFTTRWAAASRLPNAPKPVTLRNKVTKEAWAAEPEEFKQEVMASREADDKAAREAYAMAVSGEVPTTAEEYNVLLRALNNAAYYLQPFADSAHERFGMNVVILMCGPVPERGGRIEVRSIHSGKSNGMVPRIWPEYDRAGFDATQRSFVEFSQHCFTEAECRARSLNGMAMAEETDSSARPPVASDADQADPGDMSMSRSPSPAPLPPAGTATPVREDETDDIEAGGRRAPDEQLLVDPNLFTLPPSLDTLMTMEDLFGMPTGQGGLGYDLYGDGGQPGLPGDFDFGFGFGQDGLDNYNGLDGNELPRLNMRNRDDDEGSDEEDENEEADEGEVEKEKESEDVPVRPKPRPTWRGKGKTADKDAGAGSASQEHAQTVRVEPEATAATETAATQTAVTETAATETAATQTAATETAATQTAATETAPQTTKLPAPAAGDRDVDGEDGEEEEEVVAAMWSQDTGEWSEELRNAFVGYARAKSWGGKEWEEVVTELIALERARGFAQKGLLLAPRTAATRPCEIEGFMRHNRKWAMPMKLTSQIGPRSEATTFAARWWVWWDLVSKAGESADTVPSAEWEELGKMTGRNGVLLYVGALLWWGDAAVKSTDAETLLAEWRLAVEDVRGALVAARKTVPAAANGNKRAQAKAVKKAAGKPPTMRKRKAAQTSSTDKENAPLKLMAITFRKRARTRR